MLTFKEFYEICEGKKPSMPPHAVPGTYQETDGVKTYTLQKYEGPQGKPKKKEIQKLIASSGGQAVKKHIKKVEKIKEDLEQRRQELRQRQLDQMATQKKKVASYQSAQREKIAKQKEREELKREIKRELQTEQSPHMNPTPFNVMKSQAQVRGGVAHRKHVHQEIGAEARAQQAAKERRMKAILSR